LTVLIVVPAGVKVEYVPQVATGKYTVENEEAGSQHNEPLNTVQLRPGKGPSEQREAGEQANNAFCIA
jgi:hypothetical protein